MAQPTTVPETLTVDEFLVYGTLHKHSELVRGRPRVMEPVGGRHGILSGEIYVALRAFVRERGLGVCFPDSTGFTLPGLFDTVRSPDVAFVCNDRLPPEELWRGFLPVAPDLVVEILSPTESAAALEGKLDDYFATGTRLAWVVDPDRKRVCVRSPVAPERWLGEGESLDGGDVLPGFTLPLAELFAPLLPVPRRTG